MEHGMPRYAGAVTLDLSATAADLTRALVDIESVSGNEQPLADEIHAALAGVPHLSIHRDGNAIVARTGLGRPERVAIAGHIDTVPAAENLPARVSGGVLHGLGSCDMKGGVAIALRLAAHLDQPARDVTYVFYDGEEVEAERNGLLRLSRARPDLLAADFAILMEPTGGQVEGGCQGTIRAQVTATGQRAHSARSWMGRNAIHEAGAILEVLRAYQPREPEVEGLRYHEGLNAVGITGGVAGNVIPDACVVTVNYRFAPDSSVEQASAHLDEVFAGFDVRVTDAAGAARPGLDQPAVKAFVAAMGGTPRAKLGWTDVARFDALGIPAVNFGPGDSLVAHARHEHVALAQIEDGEAAMRAWLSA
jgi:succinyl-diaminopimelate desuccinylase